MSPLGTSSEPVRLAVVDRDGTIIDFHRDVEHGVVTPVFHPNQIRFLPGSIEGLVSLRDAGFKLAIATNQPGAAKGELPQDAILSVHAAFLKRLSQNGISIKASFICLHHPTGGDLGDETLIKSCNCRKPKPQMMLDALEATGALPAHAWMIGDTPTDVEAGATAGLRTALVSPTSRCELCPMRPTDGSLRPAGPLRVAPDVHAARLDLAARAILEHPATAGLV